MYDHRPPSDRHENSADHAAILREIKSLREDAAQDRHLRAEEIRAIREDLKEVLQVTRKEHHAQMEEIKGWMRRLEQKVIDIEKDVIRAKHLAEKAAAEAQKNTQWQTWAARIVLGAVLLGMVGVLVKGAW